MSAQAQSRSGEPEHGRPKSHPKGYASSKLDEWNLDPDDIGELSGRGNARLRQLTQIRGLSGEPLDPVVDDALRDVRRKLIDELKKEDGMTLDDIRRQLASHYLNVTEKVTARLNRQALPRTTRMLLSIDGVYEILLLRALQGGVGTTPADDAHGDHTHEQAEKDVPSAAQAAPPAADAASSATQSSSGA